MKKRIGLIGLGDIAQKVYLPILAQHEAGQLLQASGTLSSAAASAQTPESCSIRADLVLPSHALIEQLLSSRINGPRML